MVEEQQAAEQQYRNYYLQQQIAAAGLQYRLDGSDQIEQLIDTLRGGVLKVENGVKIYNETMRLMNEEGIARVEFYLTTMVSKTTHLTNYKNIERMMAQLKELVHAFLAELVRNMKNWGPVIRVKKTDKPPAEYLWMEEEEGGMVAYKVKVRTKRLVLQNVENSLLNSMQRGSAGFEATITGKSWNVLENINPANQGEAGGSRPGFLSRFFGGGGGGGAQY